MIAFSSPVSQYLAYQTEIDEAIRRVLDKGWYILGEEVQNLESEFAAYIGVRHGISVGNGTDALIIALKALGIGSGDEVITVSHTAVATVAAIRAVGADPVLIDIDRYHCMDSQLLENAITQRTRCVIPVHLYGQPADLDPILAICKKRGLKLIEDCAQAHGAKYKGRRVGSFGDAATFSFYPTKNLGAIGDGGMVVTNDDTVAHQAKLIRQYGWEERYISAVEGLNTRLDELQAAILRVKLRHLDTANAARVKLADLYREGLKGMPFALPEARPDTEPVYHLFVIRSSERDTLATYLRSKKVGTGIHYPVPVHQQPAYNGWIRQSGGLFETEAASREVLSLPLYPELTHVEIQIVIAALREKSTHERQIESNSRPSPEATPTLL